MNIAFFYIQVARVAFAFVLLVSSSFILLLPSAASAQQGQIINVTAKEEVIENGPVIIRADVKKLSDISQALLFYRNNLSSDFQQTEMSFDESSMSLNGTVPGSYVVSPYIEVYVRIAMRDGTVETYPQESPTENPVRITVNSSEAAEDILVISPERDQKLTVDDLMIAASMLYAPESVDRKKTKLYFDGIDVTADAVVSGDVIVYSPAKFPMPIGSGVHTAKVTLYKTDGSEYRSMGWSFTILTPEEQIAEQRFTHEGNAQLELRNENLAGSSTWYNRGDVNFGGALYGVGLGANLHLTSEEKSYRQPQDRYGFYASTSWLSLKLGDSYPTFSPLIMNGLRVRGLSGKLSAGFFNVEAAYGQTTRGIAGQYLDTIAVSPGSGAQYTGANYVKLSDSTFVHVNYGTYTRNLLAIRPSFSFGSHAQLGFTYLKSSDAISSVNLGNFPNQNLVLGSDFYMNLDEHRINFVAEGAMSVLNQNTAVGNRSVADIDSISNSDAGDQINKIVPLATLEKYFTINEYLVPLDPTKLSSLAWDVSLDMNYLNTFAKVSYVYRGPDYASFGQPYIRTDVRGLSFFLRPRLFSNQILFSISYEDLFDNLQHNKFATTQYATSNVSVSYFPMASLPSLTLGFSSYANSNSLGPDSANAVDNTTHRYYFDSHYDFHLLIRHSIQIGFGISKRDDHVLPGTNLNNSNMLVLLNSDFGQIPLSTTLGFNINDNKTLTRQMDTTAAAIVEAIQTFNYTFLTFGVTCRLFNDRFTVGVNYTPTFGDFSRNAYGLTSSFRVTKAQSLNLNVSYLAVTGSNDFVGYLNYSVDF